MAKESNIIRLDKLGRIKLPLAFCRVVEKTSGGEAFVTSTEDRIIQIYPLAAWFELVDDLDKEKRNDPLVRQFLMKANYNGKRGRVDRYRRIQIPGFLRKKIKVEDEITIEEKEGHMELKPMHT